MAGLIKNQILKHLSKFVVNLSPSQISLSALRGEGELTGLELNCSVLTQLLELPGWVRLVSATCNRAAIRIQWTKLKTVPIQLCLDEIRVMIETCDKPPGGSADSVQAPVLAQPQGYYGFTDKVVDGICLSVNLVHVTLNSLAFTASFQMSRIVVESKSPSWQKASLPHTRLKDLERGEVLIFKELTWQTVRIEARSTVATELTPLRLITNQARCRMTLKKRMSDCAVLGVRLVTILDDLLWVLTDDQLKAALHFVGSVSGLVKKSTEETQKAKAARKLDNSGTSSRKASQTSNRMFAKYDVTETSYHFYSDRIDLHFCDDPGGGRSRHPNLQGGGAFQVSLARLQVDYYPYHLARGDRKHWVRYNSDSSHRAWLLSNLASFDTRLLDVVLSGQNKTPLSRAGRGQVGGAQKEAGGGGCDEALRDLVVSQLSRLMTTNIVLRLGDLTLWRVSTSSSPGGKSSQPTEMLKGDCVRLHLPPDLPLIHLELSQFYYPGDMNFPLPPPCLLLTINPVTVIFDVLTLVWLNAFALNLEKCVASLQESFQQEKGDGGYADVKVELVMPRIVASPDPPRTPHPWRPSSLQISASKISISNYRSQSLDTGSRADLANALDKFQQSPMFFGGSFPCSGSDPSVVSEKFWCHAEGKDTVREPPPANISQKAIFRKDLLWTEARDVWCCTVASVWAEFQSGAARPVPLLDATPLSVWLYAKPDQAERPNQAERPTRKLLSEFYGESKRQEIGVQVLVLASQPVSVQLDHHQLLFLLRLLDSLAEMGAFLSSDTGRISAPNLPAGMVIGGVLPQLDVSLILAGDRDATVREDSPRETPTSQPLQSLQPCSLEPVLDLSDPLSANLEPVEATPEPPVKLQLQPAPSNGLFSPSLRSSSSSKSKNLTSSFNSKLDDLSLLGSRTRSPDLDLETLSVRSDESGDSSWHESEAGWTMVSDSLDIGEGLFKVDRTLDGIERGPSPAEMAEEVYEKGEQVECGEERMVSVLTLHLGRLAIAQISRHDGSSLLLDSSSLATSLAQDQDYQQFQFRFGQSGKSWSDSFLSSPDSRVFKLRIESKNLSDPAAALKDLPADLEVSLAEKISRISSGSLEMEVNGANLDFLSSTLTKLSEWAQDEIVPSPIPMTIHLKSLTFKLTDDNPPTPGCPEPPPLDFNIPEATLFRDREGIFNLVPSHGSGGEESGDRHQPAPTDESLRQQLDLALAEVRVLRARLAERDVKIGELEDQHRELVESKTHTEQRIAAIVEEKKSLLDTLKYLHEEIVKSGKK